MSWSGDAEDAAEAIDHTKQWLPGSLELAIPASLAYALPHADVRQIRLQLRPDLSPGDEINLGATELVHAVDTKQLMLASGVQKQLARELAKNRELLEQTHQLLTRRERVVPATWSLTEQIYYQGLVASDDARESLRQAIHAVLYHERRDGMHAWAYNLLARMPDALLQHQEARWLAEAVFHGYGAKAYGPGQSTLNWFGVANPQSRNTLEHLIRRGSAPSLSQKGASSGFPLTPLLGKAQVTEIVGKARQIILLQDLGSPSLFPDQRHVVDLVSAMPEVEVTLHRYEGNPNTPRVPGTAGSTAPLVVPDGATVVALSNVGGRPQPSWPAITAARYEGEDLETLAHTVEQAKGKLIVLTPHWHNARQRVRGAAKKALHPWGGAAAAHPRP